MGCVWKEELLYDRPNIQKSDSHITGSIDNLEFLGQFYQAFGVHEKHADADNITLDDTLSCLKESQQFIEKHAASARSVLGLTQMVTNGPQGTISHKTQKSIALLRNGIKSLATKLDGYPIEHSSLLTNVVENLHATSHMRHETFSYLDYARDFGVIMKESLKRTCLWSAKYFTH